MKINKVEITNFRILQDIEVEFDEIVTLIVGRNNSGKTSLAEVFNNFFSERTKFRFEDFTLNSHKKFIKSLKRYDAYVTSIANNEDEKIIEKREKLYKLTFPKICAKIYLEYDDNDEGKLASISNFLMDLDDKRKDALISCEFGVFEIEKLFNLFKSNLAEYDNNLIEFLRQNFNFFEKKFYTIDRDNPQYKSLIDNPSEIENIFLPRFIHAQTNLDDKTGDNTKGLSKGFESYFNLNKENDITAIALKKSLENTSIDLDINYKKFFSNLFTDLKTFGVNSGVNIQEIEIKSHFDVEEVLKDNANLFYKHDGDELLPEKSNGLGYSKLIFIVLTILSYYEEQSKRKASPNFSLLFIEEPEAHLHPQMQQTFIRNINKFIKSKGWNTQIIITTHSSHIVSDSNFDCIRYFDNTDKKVGVIVKDLSIFKNSIKTDSYAFLKQYITTSNSNMFFADKIIMVEGTVERLLIHEMINKEAKNLHNQYLSIIEVGGAYALNFRKLLKFINVKTLIITDIDSVKPEKKGNRNYFISCPVSEGILSSNSSLKKWLPGKTKIEELLICNDNEKLDLNGKIRLTYQIPEKMNDKCGRSFEEAFIIKNAKEFSDNSKKLTHWKIFTDKVKFDGKNKNISKSKEDILIHSYEIASQITKKTDFAFDILMLENWEIPKYIKEGLIWLEK